MAIPKSRLRATEPEHPYQLLPPLTDDEYASLKADIAEHGVLVPVEIDAEGRLLDGHHRLRAWTELRAEGVKVPDYPRIVRAGLSEDDKVAHVLALNLARRHLTPRQRAEVVLLLRGRGWSYRRIATAAGISEATARRDLGSIRSKDRIRLPDRIERANGGTYPARRASVMVNGIRDQRRVLAALAELGDEVPGRSLNLRTIERLALSARLSKSRSKGARKVSRGKDWEIRHGDFRKVLADLPDDSVDLITTDPPWGDDALDLFSDLGELAARVLKPGRLLVTLTGKRRLPEVIASLTGHLTWVWEGAVVFEGPHARFRNLREAWRPYLMFSKGAYEIPNQWTDLTVCKGAADKGTHPWAQPLGPFRDFVTWFTEPGDLVIDPFVGTGTSGVAAVELGRRFIGADVDAAAVKLAVDRLKGKRVYD